MTVIHTQRNHEEVGVNEKLAAGEIIYFDSNTIKVGNGDQTLTQLPEFVTGTSFVDNSTIETNSSSQKIEAMGTKNKNASDSAGVVFDWVGTKAQYQTQRANNQIPDNWVCFITDDDVDAAIDNVYTKTEADARFPRKPSGYVTDTYAVMTSGEQTISGDKIFLDGGLLAKSSSINAAQNPVSTEYLSGITFKDKVNKQIGSVGVVHETDGSITTAINASVEINSSLVYSPSISTTISQDGQTKKVTVGQKPTSTYADDLQVVTTSHIMDVLKAIYPVGSIYIGTQATCPMGAFFGTWTLVSSGKALWTGDGSAGNGSNITNGADYTSSTGATNTISAGLPNITGYMGANVTWSSHSGAFASTTGKGNEAHGWDGSSSSKIQYNFDASNSNSIYSNNVTTVQPPAYVVNVWRRTA